MDGGSLAETLASGEKFSWKVSASVVRDVIDGLFFLNGKGVAHGYVCPENILLDSSGRAKLSHPGISSLFEHEQMGRVHYIAPELDFNDEPTITGDIYAVGVVLYEMLTGHTPYSGKNIEDIREQQKIGSYAPLEDFVKKPVNACVSLLESMLTADKSQRISSYEEILLQLPEKSQTTKIMKKGKADSVADVLAQKGRPSVSAAQRIREKKELEKEQKHFKPHHVIIGVIVLAVIGAGIWLVTRPDATESALTRVMALKDGGSFDKAISVIDNCGWSLRQKYKDKLVEERQLLIKLKDGKKVFDSLKKEWEEYILYKRANRDDVSGRRKKVLVLKKKCAGNLYAEMKGLHAAIERELNRIKNE
jgi:serine/threonine protein kinase